MDGVDHLIKNVNMLIYVVKMFDVSFYCNLVTLIKRFAFCVVVHVHVISRFHFIQLKF